MSMWCTWVSQVSIDVFAVRATPSSASTRREHERTAAGAGPSSAGAGQSTPVRSRAVHAFAEAVDVPLRAQPGLVPEGRRLLQGDLADHELVHGVDVHVPLSEGGSRRPERGLQRRSRLASNAYARVSAGCCGGARARHRHGGAGPARQRRCGCSPAALASPPSSSTTLTQRTTPSRPRTVPTRKVRASSLAGAADPALVVHACVLRRQRSSTSLDRRSRPAVGHHPRGG